MADMMTDETHRKIEVVFPIELYRLLCDAARMENKSLDAIIVERVICGQQCLDESDGLEVRQ